MSRLALAAVGAAAVAGWAYYTYMYPPHLMEVATEKALMAFGEATLTKDRAKVAAVLNAHIAEGAKIHLEVTFFALTHNGKPMVQDFSKPEFVTFIDNVLYPLDMYEYQPELRSFTLNKEHTAADVTFTSKEWADGTSHYAGIAVGVRYSSATECEAHVLFAQMVPYIETASCKMALNTVPKPEEAYKIQQSPEAMQQFLMR